MTFRIDTSKKTEDATEFEKLIVKEISSIAASSPDLGKTLGGLTLISAKEVTVSGSKKAVVLIVPFKALPQYRKIQEPFVAELEKRLSERQVIIVSQRTMLPHNFTRRAGVKAGAVRPFSRTLKAVYEGLLDDVAFPAEIVGKRTRYKTDGSHILKVHLGAKDRELVENKLDTLAAVYTNLTNRKAVFMFSSANAAEN